MLVRNYEIQKKKILLEHKWLEMYMSAPKNDSLKTAECLISYGDETGHGPVNHASAVA